MLLTPYNDQHVIHCGELVRLRQLKDLLFTNGTPGWLALCQQLKPWAGANDSQLLNRMKFILLQRELQGQRPSDPQHSST